jgi:hypothetical protein
MATPFVTTWRVSQTFDAIVERVAMFHVRSQALAEILRRS